MKKTVIFIILITLLFSVVPSCTVTDTDGKPSDSSSESTSDISGVTSESSSVEITTEDMTDKVTLRIGSYNIANGRVVSHAIKLLANDILSKDLDIVGFQEVDKYAKRSKYIDTMKLLAEYTGYEYYSYTKAINIAGDEATYGQNGEYGTGILSKYPIVESGSTKLDSGSHEQRMVGYAKINVNGQIINFYNTHLSFEDFEIRTKQFETLADILKDKEHCILTGDFNIVGFTEYKNIPFMNTTCNANNWLTTFPSSGGSIDNILFSSEFTIGESGVVDRSHSDHNLLYAELTFKKK